MTPDGGQVARLSGPIVGSSGAPMAGVVARGFVFLSGVIATDGGGRIVGARSLVEQAGQALSNLGASLGAGGATPADVVKMTVYLCDAGGYASIAGLVNEFLGDQRPALTVVGVARLVNPDALIEVDATAAVPT